MSRQTVLGSTIAAGLLCLAAVAQPQRPQRTPTPNDTLVSPDVSADHRVTFRIYAPKASEVSMNGDFLTGRAAFEKDDKGIWSFTTEPLTPDFYSYSFTVDGVRTMDPKNPQIKPGITSNDNMFEVPGPEAAFEDTRPVPHGEVRIVWYQSSTLDMARSMHIYTPPGYDNSNARYPVLYLLHGSGDDDAGWSTMGRAGFIMDNLLADKKAKPMLVVMPNGSMPRAASGSGAGPGGPGGRRRPGQVRRRVAEKYRALCGEPLSRAGESAEPGHRRAIHGRRPDAARGAAQSRPVRLHRRLEFRRRGAGHGQFRGTECRVSGPCR